MFTLVCDIVFYTIWVVMVVVRDVPPSRRRYEERNPTLSLRMNADERAKLIELGARTGQSLSAILRQGLAVVETDTQAARQAGYDQGYASGFGRFEISCTRCGKPTTMNSKNDKVRIVLDEAFSRWGHGQCVRSG